MSSRGYLVDMIESIGEKICLTSHIEEKLRACEDEEEKVQLKQMLDSVLELRRKQMSLLLENAERPDPTYHCIVKHAIGSWWRDVEVWEASNDEKDLEKTIESADLLAMCLSKYLGLEFEVCSRCLWDTMLVKQVEKTKFAILNSNKEMEINE